MKRKRKAGRPRKFKLGEIVAEGETRKVVVAHRLRGTKSEYCVIPMDGRHQRYGRSAWKDSSVLKATGESSWTGSILTYRANEWLENELPDGRGCLCHCCCHTTIPKKSFNTYTGVMKSDDE